MGRTDPRPIPPLGETDHVRFWKLVVVAAGNRCWGWRGKLNNQGYAMFSVGRDWFRAHRIAWHIVNGPIPINDRVLHRCDNPNCPRPSHLFTGSQADNVADMVRKGRQRTRSNLWRGAKNPRASLSEDDAREIKRLLNTGHGQSAIARQLQVGRGAVQGIARGLTWTHLSEEEP